jgi:hypothetical protein
MPTENTTIPDKIRIRTTGILIVRAVCLSGEIGNELSAVDYTLEPETKFNLTLIQNPLIDYGHAMEMYQAMQKQRDAFFSRFKTEVEPPDCSYRHLLSLWG